MSQSASLTGAGGFTGLTPSNNPVNQRAILDANYIQTKALPSSASSVSTTGIDLGDPITGLPYATTETVNVQVLAPALTNTQLPTSATITYVLQDSADNSSFTAIALLASQVSTGAGSGMAATTYTWKLPPNTRRYINVKATTATSPGDCSAASVTLQVAF